MNAMTAPLTNRHLSNVGSRPGLSLLEETILFLQPHPMSIYTSLEKSEITQI